MNRFRDQFNDFRGKIGHFDEENMWKSRYCFTGKTHLWHYTYSRQHCWELSHVACRITSKVLGSGMCERQWGDVKTLLSGKHMGLSSEKLEKQSILYGNACMERSKVKASNYSYNEHNWGPEDLNDCVLKNYLKNINK